MTTASGKAQFTKVVAAGNDFVFLSLTEGNGLGLISPSLPDQKRRISQICDRHFGVGGDGLVVMEPLAEARSFKWHFFNKDGSPAEMCGNAARAAGRFINHAGTIRVQTLAGEIEVTKLSEEMFTVLMPGGSSEQKQFLIEADNMRFSGVWMDTGVPHFVIDLDQTHLKEPDLARSRIMRSAKEFGERGANITWYWTKNKKVEAITYERGVEDFTLACGTGAVAAAVAADTTEVEMPGGRLRVSRNAERARFELSGEARAVFCGRVFEEIFHEKI